MTAADLRRRREALGMTNAQLAAALGIPVRTFERWMTDGPPKRYATMLELALLELGLER